MAGKKPSRKAGIESLIGALEQKFGHTITADQKIIPPEMTFRQWCEKLGREGLKVDGKLFRLDNRPAMAWIYDQVPTTAEEAFGSTLVLMKCAQVGFTIFEMLAGIYFGLKFMPCFTGFYLPDMKLAAAKSTHRFMPVIRSIPDAYQRMRAADAVDGAKRGEGNVMIRQMGDSRFHFLWTTGKAMTESFPLDYLSFDEVQEMLIGDQEKTLERLSGSSIKYCMMGSTAKWPDADIDYWFKRGTRHEFWTECTNCGTAQRLDESFPHCIRFDDATDDFRYICTFCRAWIDNTQIGEWRPDDPDAETMSIHFHQMLSPTVSAREILRKYEGSKSLRNFFNRVLGKPYSDPDEIPINDEVLNQAVELGAKAGVTWKRNGRDTFMGIDQMGNFNVVIIKERLSDGRQATIHVEEITSSDPFERCSELMDQYGVAVCCVETLPNYNDAHRFANRHQGRVFLAGYSDLKDDMLVWGDAVVSKADRKTDENERDRYVVTLNQYKCMQVAFKRIVNGMCLFPDPDGLKQEIIARGERQLVPILRDRVFLHFKKTALVTERSKEAEKHYLKEFRTRVVKVGIDPHFSYANMLCDVAWARNWGTATLTIPQSSAQHTQELQARAIERTMPGLPVQVLSMMEAQSADARCGRCSAFKEGYCTYRDLTVGAADPSCPVFVPSEEAISG